MVQMPSDTSKKISPDAQMQEYLTAKQFLFTGADCWETVLNGNHNRIELLYLLLAGGFWRR